jgi:hypothetical protein
MHLKRETARNTSIEFLDPPKFPFEVILAVSRFRCIGIRIRLVANSSKMCMLHGVDCELSSQNGVSYHGKSDFFVVFMPIERFRKRFSLGYLFS